MNAPSKTRDLDPALCVRCLALLVCRQNTSCISAPRNPPRPPARAQHLHVHGAHFKKLRCKCIASRRIWLHCLTQRCNSCARRAACTASSRAATHAAAPHVGTAPATRVHERRAVAQTTSPPRRATLVAHARRRDAPWRDGATRRHTSPPPAPPAPDVRWQNHHRATGAPSGWSCRGRPRTSRACGCPPAAAQRR